ncbi:hypothetical protein [Brevundimonas sp.]|uniref:hypothetical protein n=1 Tax=Brevundimonas sp. TaxID=1871086 RepID=UPI0028A8F05C|nr:hypothetical protein [Brevundimonas sp.]
MAWPASARVRRRTRTWTSTEGQGPDAGGPHTVGDFAQAEGRLEKGRNIQETGHVDHGRSASVDLRLGVGRTAGAQALNNVDIALQQREHLVALALQGLIGAGLGLGDQASAGSGHLTLQRGMDLADDGLGRRVRHRLTFIGFIIMSMAS